MDGNSPAVHSNKLHEKIVALAIVSIVEVSHLREIPLETCQLSGWFCLA